MTVRKQAKAMVDGLGVTLKTMLKPAVTVQYPHEKEEVAPRARGVIALKEENCTVCMLCARSCPDWCIYIEGHKEKRPPRREGGRERTVSVLDRFDIDYALCMYCGICVEVCPFDALHWSPEYEYSEISIAELLHDKDRLNAWEDTVPEPEPLELVAAIMAIGAIRVVTPNNIVHAALWLVIVLAGAAGQFLLLGQEFIAWVQVIVYIGAVIVLFLFAIMLTRAPMHPKDALNNNLRGAGLLAALVLAGTLVWVLIDFWGGDKIELTKPVRTVDVSDYVFRSYLVPFEVVGVLLLGALIGAVVLARKD